MAKKKKKSLTSFAASPAFLAELRRVAGERQRSQGHCIRVALAFWSAHGRPEVPADFGRPEGAAGSRGEALGEQEF